MGTHPIFESDFDCLTVKMSEDNKVSGQPGQTLLANWVEERATRELDQDGREIILKRGHKAIISSNSEINDITTHNEFYTSPDSKPKETEPTKLQTLRYNSALAEVLAELETEKEQIPVRKNPTIP